MDNGEMGLIPQLNTELHKIQRKFKDYERHLLVVEQYLYSKGLEEDFAEFKNMKDNLLYFEEVTLKDVEKAMTILSQISNIVRGMSE